MDALSIVAPFESLYREDFSHQQIAGIPTSRSTSAILERLDGKSAHVLRHIVATFQIPESTVGLLGLLGDLKADWAELRKVFLVPPWIAAVGELREKLILAWGNDHARDLASLRSQRRSPLREFLAPIDQALPADRYRGLRCVRGLLALQLLSERGHLTDGMATETKRWFAGDGPTSLILSNLNTQHLRLLRQSCKPDAPSARLLSHLVQALELNLTDPFESSPVTSRTTVPVTPIAHPIDLEDDADSSEVPDKSPSDPLRSILAATGSAGIRVFSGVPTYQNLQPYELQLIVPELITRLSGSSSDEAIAALLTLFTRSLPSAFPRIPLTLGEGAGIWLDIQSGCVKVNLDELISSHSPNSRFGRTTGNRFIHIPLPAEVVIELRSRSAGRAGVDFVDQLFSRDMDCLGRSTKSMLRKLAVSSHRPSLTRLSNSWARFVLSICDDEAYASAAGIDFTIGTSANFNYVRLGGQRLTSILCDSYRCVGFSGELPVKTISDVGSLWLAPRPRAEEFLSARLTETKALIDRLPNRISKNDLIATHNEVATRIYSVIHFLLADRGLSEETKTRSRIDPESSLFISIDKRTSPYHERRLVLLPSFLKGWLGTYLGWLKLVAFRLYRDDPERARKILSAVRSERHGDSHPFFFTFSDKGETVPLGTAAIAPLYAPYGIENNGGRHFLDWLFRQAGLDSAEIMGWMGRGNPGQEAFSSWSTAVPMESLHRCAQAIEKFLQPLDLPAAPVLNPRRLPVGQGKKFPQYIPELLKTAPEWSALFSKAGGEPCPFPESAIFLSGQFDGLLRHWRRSEPPNGWLGIALSLIFEDGVIRPDELDGILESLQRGTLYHHGDSYFVDCAPSRLGIRRLWMSPVTVRLLFQTPAQEQGFVTTSSLNEAFEGLFLRDFPYAAPRGLDFLMECASAYFVIRIPGVLHGWMRGFRFARTSRPETIARHLMGAIEFPKFDIQRIRNRYRIRPSDDVAAAVSHAVQKEEKGHSHQSAIASLLEDLTSLLPDFERDSEDYVATSYLIHLCKSQKNILTIRRYLSGARLFLKSAAIAINDFGMSQINWQSLVDDCLQTSDGSQNDSPDRTAINHALEWLGVNVRSFCRSGPPPASFIYAEMPSAQERCIAIDLLKSRQIAVGDDWHLAATALRLLFDSAHRWDGVAHLRLCDLALDVDPPHLVIAPEAGGNLKTGNAARVLLIRDTVLVSELRDICCQRSARFPDDPLVPVFGDHDHPRTIVTTDRVHALIGEALARATGSSEIRAHDMRDFFVSTQTDALLHPDKAMRQGNTLHARQGLFHVAISTGHGAPDTSIENYAHHFDIHRRYWIDKIIADIGCPPKTEFMAVLTGIPAATYRQRISRTGNSSFDPWEKFDPKTVPATGLHLVALSQFVLDGQASLPFDSDIVAEETLTNAALYVGLRLLGETEDKARLASRSTLASAGRIEVGLKAVNLRRQNPLGAVPHINRNIFVESLLAERLVVAMGALRPQSHVINRLVAALPTLGRPWEFSNPEDILDFQPWIGLWQANGISVQATLRSGANPRQENHILDRYEDLGIRSPRVASARHFHKGANATLKFVLPRQPASTHEGNSSPQISFLTSVCAIALLLIHGDDL